MVTSDTIPIQHIRSDKDTHFTDGIAQNAVEHENIAFPGGLIGCGECVIEAIAIQSDQNLDWDVFFWGTDGNANTDLDLDTFIEYVNFATTVGKQIGATAQFYYATTSLNIPYKDNDWDDTPPITAAAELHISLVNRSGTAKNSGATGEVVIDVSIRPIAFT